LSEEGIVADITQGASAKQPTGAGAPGQKEAWNADAGFYLTMVLVSALIIFVGFSPSFFLRSVIHAPVPPLTLLTIAHGVVFTSWVALFIAQAALIASKNVALHRRLGVMGALLFGGVVMLGIWTAFTAGHLGHHPPGSPAPLAFMALPLFAILTALVLVAGALWNRQRSPWHKRLMLASLFVMTGPGTSRICIPLGLASEGSHIAIIVMEVLLAIAILYDMRSHGRIHRAYYYAVGVIAVFHLSVLWAFSSPTWLAFAGTLTAG
jgi:hypothetical protein